LRGQQLEVCGFRRDLSLVRGHQAYSMEIAYNRFHRVVNLPCQLDHSDIHSEYQDGMLLITILTRGSEA
ncbi:MAG: Hsp20/alpha crystallin family protein, partial [Planctomycetota bacterium]|nr:Hsp20/alpha crystallin family protein [Planctomycetota bacterium]